MKESQRRQHRPSNQEVNRGPVGKNNVIIHRPITNLTVKGVDGVKPATTVVCQFNPLHVVSSTEFHNHENHDCPDRHWAPGEKNYKWSEMKL